MAKGYLVDAELRCIRFRIPGSSRNIRCTISFNTLAHSFGADGVVVDTEQGLSNALSAAVKSKRTTVIGVRIDASGYVAQFNALREL